MGYKFVLIGYPIDHSLSPWIHKQFLEKSKIQGSYSIYEIEPDDSFQDKIAALKDNEINGFNVTAPYKQRIIPFLDEIDRSAEVIGAVNTVVNQDGKWIGYNTDGMGYLRSLKSKYPSFYTDKSSRILIIGAGGAARGVYYGLVSEGFKYIDITNRTVENATEIAKLKAEDTNTSILPFHEVAKYLDNYDLIVQTTSVGMKPSSDRSVFSMDTIKAGCIVSDIIYQPIETKFLKEAQRTGALVHFGHTMLLYQAQYAFEIWTGKKVPLESMDHQLKLILEGR
ncbi:shikimate dehydrogenase [Virgibacillus sp. C22-A2]|uniref:Shikimate dehydrogenase (NADP(+)) n=1 Tax=Virgibacillus tibetensis TaxID=3042313 RepID=A0ABU6KAW4_9BACI|nr:shikimate dehydrogenase [Virgibacillus sp. C22-A2]